MKKKKVKIPFSLVLTAWLFPKVERVMPWLAKRWFVRIFFTPARFKPPGAESEYMASAAKHTLSYSGKKIQVYEWGEGPVVLFVHGWMGRAGQFRKFFDVYRQAGYRVVSFDATAHGQSEGKRSHLMEFADIIKLMKDRYGELAMVVGHSLGGVAALHAVKHHQVTDKLIMLASPAIAYEIVDEFRKKIRASEKCVPYFNEYIQNKYGKRFDDYAATNIISSVKDVEVMLVYDKNDREVSIKNPALLKERYPSAKVITTEGLGHYKVLKDDGVIKSSLSFLKQPAEQVIPD